MLYRSSGGDLYFVSDTDTEMASDARARQYPIRRHAVWETVHHGPLVVSEEIGCEGLITMTDGRVNSGDNLGGSDPGYAFDLENGLIIYPG